MHTLAVLLAIASASQDSFQLVETPARDEVIVESARMEYSIHDGKVVRREGDELVTLPSTSVEGPGEAHAIGMHLGGTVFVGTDNGLFRVSDETDHLDPVEFYEGVPEGALVGVVPRGQTRIWVVTRDEIGCVDSRQFFGRTFGPDDGAPPGPYLGLADDQVGGLLLETESGTYRYEPARGDRPTLNVVSVNGRAFEDGSRHDVSAEGTVELELSGEALGGATYRYRGLRHHLWYPLDTDRPRIEGLEPGQHSFLITAWDRNLRRSLPVRIELNVAYPEVFDKSFLIPLAVGIGFGVLVFWLLLALRSGGGVLRFQKAFLSAFVFCVIGLQIIAGIIPHGRSWPFVGFTMYTERYEEGSVTYKQVLYGVERSGNLHQIQPYNAGYGLAEFRRTLAPVIHGTKAERAAFLDYLNTRYPGRPFKGMIIADERHRLTRNGPVHVAPTILCVHPRDVLHD